MTEIFKKPRGFAAMSADRQREIASMGGLAVPPDKRSFAQDRDLAATAGRKGGSRGGPRGATGSKSNERDDQA